MKNRDKFITEMKDHYREQEGVEMTDEEAEQVLDNLRQFAELMFDVWHREKMGSENDV